MNNRLSYAIDRNLKVVEGLTPISLWEHFAVLSAIPRPSFHKSEILKYLKSFADTRHLPYASDSVGNLVIKRPGSGGGENAPPVIIQSHVDIVAEKKEETTHDFFTDPINLCVRDNGWLGAVGTTLGADNGIGICAALSVLNSPRNVKLPPLECLLTVEEQSGLTGASEMDAAALGLTGKKLLNLTTQQLGALCVGCAGGGDTHISLGVTRSASVRSSRVVAKLSLSGLMGGHSGVNIHENRGNAVKLLAIVVEELIRTSNASLIKFCGGSRHDEQHNTIPRKAMAFIAFPNKEIFNLANDIVTERRIALQKEYGTLERNLQLELDIEKDAYRKMPSLDNSSNQRLVGLLLGLPSGVLKMSHSVENLVETSNNLVACHLSAYKCSAEIITSTRSSFPHAIEDVRHNIAAQVKLAGGIAKQQPTYPGWQSDMSSPLLSLTRECAEKILKQVPRIGSLHTGLECGVLSRKLGGKLDMVCFGPTIIHAHSPNEAVEIATVAPFYKLLCRVLDRLADKHVAKA